MKSWFTIALASLGLAGCIPTGDGGVIISPGGILLGGFMCISFFGSLSYALAVRKYKKIAEEDD